MTGRSARVTAVVLLVAAAGLLAAWWTPRGPLTAAEALVSMALAAALGLAAGMVLRSRWSMLLAPTVFVVAFELGRIGAQGPTVDAVAPTSVYAAIALVAGRGVHALLVLAPMAVGARFGVEIAVRRRRARRPRLSRAGWAALALATAALVGVAALVVRPASTAPVAGPDGVADLADVRIGGTVQSVMIRGQSTDNPVLLHLAGGPGGTDIGAMRLDERLEERFVVATWDQPGTGKSYPAIEPEEEMTVERVVDDTLAVTDYLRERFGQEQILLTGQSWGTIPGALAVQRHPEKYLAFVGTGQMVDVAETDRMFYDDTLAWARERGNDDLVTRLRELGPPPYDDLLDYTTIVGSERELNPYPEFDGSTEMPATIWVPENSVMDRVNAARGLLDTYSLLYPQLQDLDLRRQAPRLDVPVYVVMGEHEARGRVEPAQQWFDALDAPVKHWVELPDSSHRASFEQPAAYAELLERVIEDAGAGRSQDGEVLLGGAVDG